eukprot:tig00000057_g82.t1
MCTRRPIILRLIHASDVDGILARFTSGGGQEISMDRVEEARARFDFSLPRPALNSIPESTDEPAADAPSQLVREEPVVLELQCAHCPDLTVIDLPGIARLAREVDPEGVRTIGVLTKVDIMDDGTDASDVLLGRQHRLTKGYFAVKNRSQREVEARRTVKAALEAEEAFFGGHAVYGEAALAPHCGTARLIAALQRKIKCRPKPRLITANNTLAANKSMRLRLAMELLRDFRTRLRGAIDGAGVDRTDAVYGGAHLRREVFEPFAGRLRALPRLVDDDPAIATLVTNKTGRRPDQFIPYEAFRYLARKAVLGLEAPSAELVRATAAYLRRLAADAAEAVRP